MVASTSEEESEWSLCFFIYLSMAPAIASSSQSFLLTTTTTPNSTLSLAPHKRFALFAKKPDQELDDNSKFNPFRFDFSSIPDVKSLIPVISNNSPGLSSRRKDPATVFVAGATGQAGIRISQTLLRQGFSVRAGVPRLDAAQELALLASNYKIISGAELKRFNAVQCTFQDAESIAKAIGNASKVAVTIGPCENGPDSQVTAADALLVVEAAQLAGVDHLAIVCDGNTAPASSPNDVLNGISSFFNNLFSRTLSVGDFLEKVVAADVNYTFIKTSLTEDYSPESSYNLVVTAEGANPSDYKVAKSRIACLVADVFSNTAVAENKIVEVSTSPSSPLMSTDELFSAIPEDGRRKAYAEAAAKAKAEEQTKIAAEKAQEAAASAKKLKSEVNKLSQEGAEDVEAKAAAAGASIENLFDKAKGIGSGLSWDKFSSQVATAVQNVEIPKVQLATVRGQAKAQTLPSKKAVVRQSAPKPRVSKAKEREPKAKPAKPTGEVRNVFGGLFKQETIYIDDD